jgi:hypothetical protein
MAGAPASRRRPPREDKRMTVTGIERKHAPPRRSRRPPPGGRRIEVGRFCERHWIGLLPGPLRRRSHLARALGRSRAGLSGAAADDLAAAVRTSSIASRRRAPAGAAARRRGPACRTEWRFSMRAKSATSRDCVGDGPSSLRAQPSSAGAATAAGKMAGRAPAPSGAVTQSRRASTLGSSSSHLACAGRCLLVDSSPTRSL